MSLSVKKAVVLLSGGLDSATVMAIARHAGYQCYALSFAYGQRHDAELQAARRIAATLQATQHKILPLSLDEIGGSALTDTRIPVPVTAGIGIPSTYVPARNTIFLSLALGWAEVLACSDIFIGVNAVDYSGYPDCRPEYIQAYEKMANLATKAAVEGTPMRIHAPLLHLSKADIIRRGAVLGLNYAETVSCYQADAEGRACAHCDACRLRAQGFQQAGIPDPTAYVT